MLRGSLIELIRKGVVAEVVRFLVLVWYSHILLTPEQDIPDRRTISLWKNAAGAPLSDMTGWKAAAELWSLAELCKVPFISALLGGVDIDSAQTGPFGASIASSPRPCPCEGDGSRQILFCTRQTEEGRNCKWDDDETMQEFDAGRALAESDGDSGGRAEEAIRDVDLNEAMGLV